MSAYAIGGQNALELIQTIELGATGAIDFQSIPATYKHLKISAQLRGAQAADEQLRVRINNDTSNNYDYNWGGTSGTTELDDAVAATAFVALGRVPGTGATASLIGAVEIEIPAYAGTTLFKRIRGTVSSSLGTASTDQREMMGGGVWKSTSAINRILIWTGSGAGEFVAGSVASLYGLRG